MSEARKLRRGIAALTSAVLTIGTMAVTSATPASAGHGWNGYHWAAGSYPINLRPVNSFSPGFRDAGVSGLVMTQWNRSGKFQNVQRYGDNSASTRRNCPWVSGSVRMCDYDWGANGWAGLAQVYVPSGRHIRRALVKVNNHYGTSYSYRVHVLCQEFGHILGLDHQANGNHSCMDDSSAGWDELSPNDHDYDMLRAIYDHTHQPAPATSGGRADRNTEDLNRTVTTLSNGDRIIQYVLPAPRGHVR